MIFVTKTIFKTHGSGYFKKLKLKSGPILIGSGKSFSFDVLKPEKVLSFYAD
jgi:hypothetical protein